MRRTIIVLVAGGALATAGAAAAHVVLTPPFAQDGEIARVSLDVPNERPPHRTIEVEATAPPGVEIRSAAAPPGWTVVLRGGTATWRGGSISGRVTTSFPLRIYARVRAGTYTFRSAQHYDDGAVVRWAPDISILPASGAAAPRQHPLGAVIAAIAGVIVIVASMLGLRALRGRSLQER